MKIQAQTVAKLGSALLLFSLLLPSARSQGVGPYVTMPGLHTGGTPTYPFAQNASALGSVPATGYVQNFSQGLYFWLNAQQTLLQNPSLTNLQVPPLQDQSGNNWGISNGVFGAGSVLWAQRGINGQPSFYFNSANLEVSNILAGVSNFTLEITFQELVNPGQNFLVTGGGWGSSAPRNCEIIPWIDNGGTYSSGEASTYTGGALYFYPGLTTAVGVQQRQWMAHVLTESSDGENIWMSLDGKPIYDSRIEQAGSLGDVFAGCTNMYIGSDSSLQYGGAYFNGYISDFRLYTNSCTPSFERSLIVYCCTQAGLPVNTINWEGDSISEGLHATVTAGGEQQILAPSLPGWLIDTEAYSGRTSSEVVTNVFNWGSWTAAGKNIARVLIDVNDFNPANFGGGASGIAVGQSNEVAISLANDTNIIRALTTNGVPVAICTLPSNLFETNSLLFMGYDWRSNLNATLRTFTNFPGVQVIDYAADIPSMGTNYAFLNTNWANGTAVFNSDEIHPTSLGYTNMAQVSYPVLEYMTVGSTSEDVPTNVAPFSMVLPLIDSYGGHIYYASGPMWVLIK